MEGKNPSSSSSADEEPLDLRKGASRSTSPRQNAVNRARAAAFRQSLIEERSRQQNGQSAIPQHNATYGRNIIKARRQLQPTPQPHDFLPAHNAGMTSSAFSRGPIPKAHNAGLLRTATLAGPIPQAHNGQTLTPPTHTRPIPAAHSATSPPVVKEEPQPTISQGPTCNNTVFKRPYDRTSQRPLPTEGLLVNTTQARMQPVSQQQKNREVLRFRRWRQHHRRPFPAPQVQPALPPPPSPSPAPTSTTQQDSLEEANGEESEKEARGTKRKAEEELKKRVKRRKNNESAKRSREKKQLQRLANDHELKVLTGEIEVMRAACHMMEHCSGLQIMHYLRYILATS